MVDSTGKAVDSVSRAIEKAIFGDTAEGEETPQPDPFAKLKAAEAEKKEREKKR